MKRRVGYLGVAVLCVGALAGLAYYIAVYHVLPYSPIRPHRISRDEVAKSFPKTQPRDYGLRSEPLDVDVEDSIKLKGWFVFAKTDTPMGTIILLHGIADSKESLLGFADTLARLGYNCILYDSRAHGESGGTDCTFGYYEKTDVSAYINAATKRFTSLEPFGIYGNSLGAAVAIQTMAIDRRIMCGIVESPFATLREVIYDYWKRLSGLPIRFIPNDALRNSERIAHFVADSVKPEESAKRIGCPVLVAHGDQDKHISIDYGKRVYRNLRSPEKQWYPIHGANHYDLSRVGGEAYFDALRHFLQAHLRK